MVGMNKQTMNTNRKIQTNPHTHTPTITTFKFDLYQLFQFEITICLATEDQVFQEI